MLFVKVGKPERRGRIHITFKQYKDLMLVKGGDTYVTVYLEDGDVRDWRVKYMREVTDEPQKLVA